MASKKKTTKKSTGRVGQIIELTSAGQKALTNDEFGPQAKLVATALNTKGSATAAQVASAIGSKLKTEQPVVRVVAYYFGQFKKAGQAKAVKTKAKSEASAAA